MEEPLVVECEKCKRKMFNPHIVTDTGYLCDECSPLNDIIKPLEAWQ